jgi:hypothetical protein
MNLTANFTLGQFDKKGRIKPDTEAFRNLTNLAENLQKLRDYISLENDDVEINVVAACQSIDDNNDCKSVHISIEGMKPSEIAHKIEGLIIAGRMNQGALEADNRTKYCYYDIRGRKKRG